ncbi:LptA/OstA family protein [Bradyrhizobium sp. LHD-71]|uniref:LptA/OstA family protein n=1 Tax=Bradyrhizobium sp. LHD-71 TaxID=3072141 RepID=UPI0028107EC0|nr:LptA/OstA family protein [Bradyrhizobium sp. LHD-71]MDQ8732247.1 LptA/OstA family protein [Bradyrhizobium sp. LHD-71]
MIGPLHFAVAIAVAIGCHAVAHAQASPKAGASQSTGTAVTGPPNALQGFSQNRDKPIQIDAARLEVRDKDKVATFFGDAKADVKVVQGDVTMRSKILVVFYDQDDAAKSGAGKTAKAAAPGPGGSSQIRRLEAKGNVIVTQKDQTVTGESGVFDMKTNTVTMFGGVVLTQSDNVLRGDRLVVDMTTGVSRVEGGRVQGLFKSSSPPGGSGNPSPQGTKPGGPLPLSGGRQ